MFTLRKLNKKLDQIIKEERIVKQELDMALGEETDQIALLADLMGNVKVIRKISEKKNKKIQEAEKAMTKAKGKDKKEAIKHAIDQLHDVDKLSKEEENVLLAIGKDVKKYAKKGVELPANLLNVVKSLIPGNHKKKK
jgi:hypothetical protein